MRKCFIVLLFSAVAVFVLNVSAWALPWEGWTTTSQEFSKEMMLGRQLMFNYQFLTGNNQPGAAGQGDTLQIRTESGVLIGEVSEFQGTYPDWKSVSLEVPSSLVFTRQNLVFSANENGPRTDPHFVMNAISSPVPEPATLILLGSGLLGLAASRRRRK